MKDKEIYQKIVEEQKWCQLCGSTNNLHIHHIFEGRNRKNSTKYNMLVRLCNNCHSWVHKTNYQEFKKKAQKEFEMTHTRDEFIQIFRRNYL